MSKSRISDYHSSIQEKVDQHNAELLKNVRLCNKKYGARLGPVVSTFFYGITEEELKNASITKVPRKKATDPVTEKDYNDYVKINLEIYKLKRYKFLQKCGSQYEIEHFVTEQRSQRGIGEKRAEAIEDYREKKWAARQHVSIFTKVGNGISNAASSLWSSITHKPPEEPVSVTASICKKQAIRKIALTERKRTLK